MKTGLPVKEFGELLGERNAKGFHSKSPLFLEVLLWSVGLGHTRAC